MNRVLALVFLFIIKTAAAQLPEFQWAKAFLAHNEWNYSVYSNGRAVVVDQQGNVYSTGIFTHTTDFDPGPGVFTLTATGISNSNLYISKLSPTGDFIWAIQVATWVEFGNIEIKVDKDNNVYLASELRAPADFDPGPGVHILTPIGGWDAFVAKYDPNGNLVWAKQFGGPGDTVPRSDVLEIDGNNNVIVCGNFNNTVDFDPGPNTFNITSTAHIQSFIVKLNSSGELIWALQFGNSPVVYSGSNIADVKCDRQGNIYLVGNFSGVCDFDPGPGNYTLQGPSFSEGYISKLDASGQFVWAKRIGNTTNDYHDIARSWGIDLDNDNNVYTVGHFTGTFDFDPGPNSHLITSSHYDWYVLKLNGQGDLVWVAIMGGSDLDAGYDVATDNAGSVYTVGNIGPVADMDPGPGIYPITTIGQYGAAVLTKLNSNGGFVYATPFDGTGACYIKRVVVDNSKNIYFTGYMYGSIDYDPAPTVFNLQGDAGYTPFVVKLGPCKNITMATLNISTCNSYTLNNETFDSSGTYYRTIPNASGCDSIITLHLTINRKFSEQTIAICQGNSFFAGGTNQTLPGTYIDTLRTSLSCDSIVTTHLIVHPAPLPNLGADRDICTGTQAVISPGTFTSYKWQDGSTAPSFVASGVGTYYVTVQDNNQCKGSDTVRITALLPSPSGFLPLDTAICSYNSVLIKARESFSSYQWSNNASSPSITLTSPGTYWLQVKDGHGCIGRDSIIVKRKECLTGFYIPNAFTPDKNRRNDVFKPIIGGVVKQYQFSIYNRWGQLVFATKVPGQGWDGTIGGVLQGNNVFAWTCTYQLEGESLKVEKGTVLLIR